MRETTFAFGPFQFTPARGALLEEGKRLRLGSRAMEVLTALLECGGELVRHEELLQRVWPNTFVSESNLRVHIRAIRRVLREETQGSRYVLNIPGQGYRFAVPIHVSFAELSVPVSAPKLCPASLPKPFRGQRISRPCLPVRCVIYSRSRKMIGVAKIHWRRPNQLHRNHGHFLQQRQTLAIQLPSSVALPISYSQAEGVSVAQCQLPSSIRTKS